MDDLPNAKRQKHLSIPPVADLSEVKGQLQAKRVLEIAAAGSHNLLMLWPIKYLIRMTSW
ncbi:MAG: ATP-binding protein [Alcanivoracaceae bacterium]|nr:ATP-binding protein [Alcanivoracaceae bacterium]